MNHESTNDLILTKTLFFKKTPLPDFGLLVLISKPIFKDCPKTIYYKNKNFLIKTALLQDLKKVDFELKTDDPRKNYTFLKNIFPDIVKRQARLKKDMLENAMLCIDRQLDKAIYTWN